MVNHLSSREPRRFCLCLLSPFSCLSSVDATTTFYYFLHHRVSCFFACLLQCYYSATLLSEVENCTRPLCSVWLVFRPLACLHYFCIIHVNSCFHLLLGKHQARYRNSLIYIDSRKHHDLNMFGGGFNAKKLKPGA